MYDQRLPSPTTNYTSPYRRPSPIAPSSTYTPPSATSPHVSGFEQRRRSLLSTLNSRYIYGRVPLLHSIVFLCEMALVSLLIQRFNLYYARRPILTTMITNAVLGGIADTVAQSLTAIRYRAARKARSTSRDDSAIDLQDFDSKSEWTPPEYRPMPKNLPPPFDFERLTRFMSYGFLMAPVQHKWFAFLGRVFPVSAKGGSFAAFEQVAFDQLIFAPMGLGVFFAFMTVAEGGGKRAIIRKLQDVYIPALKANYMIWPAVQMVNFRFMPIQLQIPFVSTIGIAWTAYLSLTNASEEPELL